MSMRPDVDYPAYSYQGMGCGLEDRGITDRYEAMYYGWEEALDRCATEVVEPLCDEVEALAEIVKLVYHSESFNGLSLEIREKILEQVMKK